MPAVEVDLPMVQGDPWSYGFPCFNPSTNAPQSLAGYGCDFSISQNFGDAKPLIFITSSTPSANGSNVAILPYTGSPGTGVICVVTPLIRAADTMALGSTLNVTGATVINAGAKTTRLWGHLRVIPPGGDPSSVWYGGLYLRTKA